MAVLDGDSFEQRLVVLELRFMQQASELEELNEVVISQGAELEQLRAELSGVRKKLSAEPGLVDPKDDGPPPHY